MTECGGAMTLTRPEDPLEFHASTVGRPKLAGAAGVPGTDDLCVYQTADPLTGEDLPAGAEGELISTGPTHMLGYWDKPEETAQALRGGWVHSGDLGVVQPDGYLRVTGRSKELYKSGGELVMPKEIEDLLTRHPGVSQAFVVGVADERWGDVGCAWIVPEPGAAVDEDGAHRPVQGEAGPVQGAQARVLPGPGRAAHHAHRQGAEVPPRPARRRAHPRCRVGGTRTT